MGNNNSNGYKILRLRGVKSPWNGQHYIGFVLDIINKYLRWESKEYHMSGGKYSEAKSATMHHGESVRGEMIRVDSLGKGRYAIRGFPQDRDFDDFKRQAQGILENVLKR
jgi:hypothetical protein